MTKPMHESPGAEIAEHIRRAEEIEADGFITLHPPMDTAPPASPRGAGGSGTTSPRVVPVPYQQQFGAFS